MKSKKKILPLAYLEGVTEHLGEHQACSLVFHLETPDGASVDISYALLITILRFAQDSDAVPPLSRDWWRRIGNQNGFALQDRCGA